MSATIVLPLLIQPRPISIEKPPPIELTAHFLLTQLIPVLIQLPKVHPINNPLLVPILLLPILNIAIPQQFIQHTFLLILNMPPNQFLSFLQNNEYDFYHQQFISKEVIHI